MEKRTYILALDASTDQGVVALFADGVLQGQLVYRQPKAHARLLAPMVDTLLRDMGIAPAALDAIAVISGPGSYTGLRVATSTAKGLCLATGAQLMAMSSLEMLAHAVQGIAAQQAAYICPLIDARRMEAYSQLFDQTISPQNKPEAILFEEKPFDALLKKEKVVFTGDGLEKAVPLLEGYSNAILLPQWPQGLAHVGLHLQRKFIQNDFEQLALFEPFYLKGVRITRSKKQQK